MKNSFLKESGSERVNHSLLATKNKTGDIMSYPRGPSHKLARPILHTPMGLVPMLLSVKIHEYD